MKHRTLSAIASVIALFLAAAFTADAQPNPQDGWKERMQSVKIAFLTNEIGLTPTEAQSFWPIYNVVNEELDKAVYSTFSSYMELEKAINENKSDKEVSKYLERYLEEQDKLQQIKAQIKSKLRLNRAFTEYEEVYIAEWINKYGYTFDENSSCVIS